ncbi:MAG: MCE family protein [Acidimicrobiales bacterium]
MRSFRDRNPYAVGIISVLLIGAITGFAFAAGLLHLLEHTYELRSQFRDAAGLREGDSVRVAGVKVGRVTGISADRQKGLVEVSFVVNQGLEVHDGVQADVALETLLGAKYIRLRDVMKSDKSTERLESLKSDDPLRTIPVERTTTPYDVFELARRATEGISNLDTKSLNSVINQLAVVTDDKQQSISDLITGLNKVSSAINQRDGQLTQLLDRADTVSKTLADKDQTLVALIDQSKQILDLLATRRDSLTAALGEGSLAVQRLSQLIGDHQKELDDILSTLHPTLAVIAANQGHIDNALTWLGPGFYNQSLAGTHGDFLDIFIRSLGATPGPFLCDLLQVPAPCPS